MTSNKKGGLLSFGLLAAFELGEELELVGDADGVVFARLTQLSVEKLADS